MCDDDHLEMTKLRRYGQRVLLRWLPLLLWMAWIYWLSDRPSMPHPGRSVGISDDLFDYTAHAFTFGVLTVLAWRVAVGGLLPRDWLGRAPAIAGAFAALYALGDEIHQSFVPGRWAKVEDWLADVAGILAAVALLVLWQRHGDRLRERIAPLFDGSRRSM